MPSKSPAQRRLMQAVAHSPEFARKVGVPQAVGKEFVEEDKDKARRKSLADELRRRAKGRR